MDLRLIGAGREARLGRHEHVTGFSGLQERSGLIILEGPGQVELIRVGTFQCEGNRVTGNPVFIRISPGDQRPLVNTHCLVAVVDVVEGLICEERRKERNMRSVAAEAVKIDLLVGCIAVGVRNLQLRTTSV